ncbi:unnamed protein product [Spodoptera exigua]|nr:unnamed protein product [Spodoptera exigua]
MKENIVRKPGLIISYCGWANPLIVNWFEDYARVVYTLFADRVKIFVTVNEPFVICELGYNKGHIPYHQDQEIGRFLCNKNTILAHAKAWRLYDEEFRPLYHGETKYGLYEVDFTDPHRKRTPRKSARYYADLIRNRSLYIPPAHQINRF